MQLFFKETYIGDIMVTGGDFPWVHGVFNRSTEYEDFKGFFAYLVFIHKNVYECHKTADGNAFDAELFDENNWSIRDGVETTLIFPPCIYDEANKIGFRYYWPEDWCTDE